MLGLLRLEMCVHPQGLEPDDVLAKHDMQMGPALVPSGNHQSWTQVVRQDLRMGVQDVIMCPGQQQAQQCGIITCLPAMPSYRMFLLGECFYPPFYGSVMQCSMAA